MRLRTATSADHDAVVAAIAAWWGDRDLTGLMQPLFLQHFASTSLVAEDAGRMCGFLVGFRSADDPASAYVHFVGVHPERRGSGLGRQLHDEFARRMAAAGVEQIRCVTSPANETSVAFHTAIGFTVEGVDPTYVHLVRRVPAGRVDPRPADPAWPDAVWPDAVWPDAVWPDAVWPDAVWPDAVWPDAVWPVPSGTVLEHGPVALAQASPADAEELFAALDDDDVWRHVRGRPGSADELAGALAEAPGRGRFPWIVRRAGEVVGTTSYLEVSPVDARLEIGFTLYARRVWATEVNPACKLLLMEWAFEVGGMGRVQLKTDIRNTRSRRAIERLGATGEGVLRRYQRRADGSVRDTVVYSVTAEDWPRIREGLRERLLDSPKAAPGRIVTPSLAEET